MKKKNTAAYMILAFSLIVMIFGSGCGNAGDEDLKKLIRNNLNLLETEITGMEQNQENMRVIISDMQKQLDVMQEELDKETPRIHAANVAIDSLKTLTTVGNGATPGQEVLKNPTWSYSSIMWLLLFLFILWVLYRIRHKNTANG